MQSYGMPISGGEGGFGQGPTVREDRPMMRLIPPAEVDAALQAKSVAAEQAAAKAAEAVEVRLESRCFKEFESARLAKEPIQRAILACMYARASQYTPEEMAFVLAEKGTQIFLPITSEKCTAAVAWAKELYGIGTGTPMFKLKPTPVPEIPDEIKAVIEFEGQGMFQEQVMAGLVPPTAMREFIDNLKSQTLQNARQWAERQAETNTRKVDDVMREGGFYDAFGTALDYAMCAKLGIVKTVVRRKKRLKWRPNKKGAELDNSAMRQFEAVPPLDFYPAPGISDVNAGHVTHRMRMPITEFAAMKGMPGMKSERIAELLLRYGSEGCQNWWWSDSERAQLEQRDMIGGSLTPKGMYDVLHHHTYATGKELMEFGIPGSAGLVEDEVYSIECWLVERNRLIGARINSDPLGHRPYFTFGFRQLPNSLWYESIPEIIRPIQQAANAALRNMINDMAESSGSFSEVQIDRLAEGEAVTAPYARGVIQTRAPLNGSAGPAVYVHKQSFNAPQYMAVMDWAGRYGDIMVGLPSFLSGVAPTSGAGTTSSGLAQLHQMATRTFKLAISYADAAICKVVKSVHVDLVLTDGETDPDLAGDLAAEAIGSASFADDQAKRVRMNELLQTTANPIDLQIMGTEGRAEVLRAAFEGFDAIDIDRAIPSREAVLMKAKQAAMAAAGMGAAGMPPPNAATVRPDGSTPADMGAMQ